MGMLSTLNVKLVDVGITDGERGIPYGKAQPSIHVAFGAGSYDEAAFRHYCDSMGSVSIENMGQGPYTVHPRAEGYSGDPVSFTMPRDGQWEIGMKRTGSGGSGQLSRLHVEGHDFKNEQGARVEIAGSSFFQGYQWFLEGKDWISPAKQLQDLGCNGARVFAMDFNIPLYDFGQGPFKPDNYGSAYFDRIPEFMLRMGEFGMYVYWSVFPDIELIYPGSNNNFKRGFLNQFVAKAKIEPNGVGEVTNEQDAHSFNAVNPAVLDRPSGIAFNSGSYGDIGGPQPFVWDFCDYHVPRGNRIKTIKDSNPCDHPNSVQGAGVLLGEGDRMGSTGNSDVELTRLAAGACRENAMGQFLHTTNGKHAKVFDGATLPHAQVFFKAMGRI